MGYNQPIERTRYRAAHWHRLDRTVAMLKPMLLLLFCRSRFEQVATERAIQSEFSSNQQLREAYPDGKLPPERVEEFARTVREQTSNVRRALLGGIGITLLTILLGYLFGLVLSRVVGPPSKALVYILQALGAGVILGATLGEIGRDIETWDRNTLPELVNAWTFRAFYIVGTFLFVTSVSWDAV